jgi:hypothetical protein
MNLEIDDDIADKIVAKGLNETLDYYEWVLRQYKTGNKFIALFYTDKDKDIAEIKKRIKALKLTLEAYEVS